MLQQRLDSTMGSDTGKKNVASNSTPTLLTWYFVTIYFIAALAAIGCFGDSAMSPSAWRNISVSLMIPLAGGVLELLYVFSNKYSEDTLGTMASGPIMPISCFWYLYSNYLCANASIKYCNITPYWLLVLAWSGLMVGGLDHIIETWQWGMGWLKGDHKQRHKRFGNLWLDLQPYGGMLAPMLF
ncbi:unnamed protein product [Polarella glacialis]|uniref:Uncharacterized protein n=1 Tax=Polarella glacialis TaxID=89957 RepID=A0A813DGJ5_POLGL|nr:unnamed protein product [Polarella glacialis]